MNHPIYGLTAIAFLNGATAGPKLREPAPEKYPGQRLAGRKGAWKGDGVPADPARSKGRKCRQN